MGKRKRKREENGGDSLAAAASVSGLAFCDPLSRSAMLCARAKTDADRCYDTIDLFHRRSTEHSFC